MALRTYTCQDCKEKQERIQRAELKCVKCKSSNISLEDDLKFNNSTQNYNKFNGQKLKEKINTTLKQNIQNDYYNA